MKHSKLSGNIPWDKVGFESCLRISEISTLRHLSPLLSFDCTIFLLSHVSWSHHSPDTKSNHASLKNVLFVYVQKELIRQPKIAGHYYKLEIRSQEIGNQQYHRTQ